jgi:hypothetical protein
LRIFGHPNQIPTGWNQSAIPPPFEHIRFGKKDYALPIPSFLKALESQEP